MTHTPSYGSCWRRTLGPTYIGCKPDFPTMCFGPNADIAASNVGLGADSGQSYSITSSAAFNKPKGTVSPSVLAVLRLMTNSNLVGVCTGRLAGLSPFRMRPV